jgi:hypothetical protein
MSKIVIVSKRLVRRLKKAPEPVWTWERWPDNNIFFYGWDICTRLGDKVAWHEIVKGE